MKFSITFVISACLLHGSTPLLLASPPQGLRFYIGTSDVVKKTLQEAQDFVFTRGVQREELKQVGFMCQTVVVRQREGTLDSQEWSCMCSQSLGVSARRSDSVGGAFKYLLLSLTASAMLVNCKQEDLCQEPPGPVTNF